MSLVGTHLSIGTLSVTSGVGVGGVGVASVWVVAPGASSNEEGEGAQVIQQP